MDGAESSDRPLILVADDEPDLRDLLDLLLTDAGYDVVTVADGADAVRVALERAVDLLVLDLRMPGWRPSADIRMTARLSRGNAYPAPASIRGGRADAPPGAPS